MLAFLFSISAILGDPGADSGDEEKSKRAEKYMARRKVKNGEKSPWEQCLTRPVPKGLNGPIKINLKCNNKVNKEMLHEKLNKNSLLQQHMPLTCVCQKGKWSGGNKKK